MWCTFGSLSACLQPSLPQVPIFIGFKPVLGSLGCFSGVSWQGFFSFFYLPLHALSPCLEMPGSKRGAAIAPLTGLSIESN